MLCAGEKKKKSFKAKAAALCGDKKCGKLGQPPPVWKRVLECDHTGCKHQGFDSRRLIAGGCTVGLCGRAALCQAVVAVTSWFGSV